MPRTAVAARTLRPTPRSPRRPRPPVVFALSLLLGCGAPAEKEADDGPWLTPTLDLGPAQLSGGPTGAAPGGDALWFALAQHLPGLRFDDPGVDLPLSLWELAQQDQIADIGSCPYRDLTAQGERWASSCRSQDGYQWEGGVETAAWSEGGLRWSRTDFDLEITADVDDPSFEHLRIVGAAVYASPDTTGDLPAPEGLHHATQANIRVELRGLWAQVDPQDPREPAWDGWASLGRTEQIDALTQVDALVALGGVGQLALRSDSLAAETDCGAVPRGEVALQDANLTLNLTLDPAGDCQPCAAVEAEGEDRGLSCEG
jgi:hypothetical protein